MSYLEPMKDPTTKGGVDAAVIIGVSVAFLTLGLALTFCTPGKDKSLMRFMINTALVCMWAQWIITYASQVQPLVAPIAANAE